MGLNKKRISVISRDMNINGDVRCKGELFIEGKINGKIEAETVVVLKEGIIESDVRVMDMTVGGTVAGEMMVEGRLLILGTGKCNGRILCKELMIEPGGILNADVEYKG